MSYLTRVSGFLLLTLFTAQASWSQTFEPFFNNDVGSLVSATSYTRDGTLFTISGSCTGIVNCGDYFDISLSSGESLLASFCADKGGDSSAYDSSLAIYALSDLVTPITSNDDTCGLAAEVTHTSPMPGDYRVALGTFSAGNGDDYTLAFSVSPEPSMSTIPTLPQWGVILMSMLLLGAGWVAKRRTA